MGSHHHHHHGHSHEHGDTKNITAAFWLNTLFALVEIAGGLYTNSVAILSDAVHDLGDSLSLGFAYYFQEKSKGRRDSQYSYGYRRFSLVGAMLSSLVLILGSFFVLTEAIRRLKHPEQADASGMVVLSVIGIAVNLVAMLRLKRGGSLNEKMVSLHFLEDVLGWTAVLAGAVVMLFVDVPLLDPILSILISGYVLFNVYRNLRSVFRIVLQGVPVEISEEEVRQHLAQVKEISDIHDLHIWTMDGKWNILTMHAVVDPELTIQDTETIKEKIRQQLDHLNIRHATIEIETGSKHCDFDE